MSFTKKVFKYLFTIKFESNQLFLSGVFYSDFSKSGVGHLVLCIMRVWKLLREQREQELCSLPPEIAQELSCIAD